MVTVLNARASEFIPAAAIQANHVAGDGDRHQTKRSEDVASARRESGSTGRQGGRHSGTLGIQVLQHESGRVLRQAHRQRKTTHRKGEREGQGQDGLGGGTGPNGGAEAASSARPHGGRGRASRGGLDRAAQIHSVDNSSSEPQRVSIHRGAPNNKCNHGRRRSHRGRTETSSEPRGDSNPHPPHPRRASRDKDAQDSGSHGSAAGCSSTLAVAESAGQSGVNAGAKGRAVAAFRSGNSYQIESICQRGYTAPPSFQGSEREEAFPALPLPNEQHKNLVVAPPPVSMAAITGPEGVDYSSLAERLASETAAAAAAVKASGPVGGATGGASFRLSILPNFGDGPSGKPEALTVRNDVRPAVSESQVSGLSSSNPAAVKARIEHWTSAQMSSSPSSSLQSPPEWPTLAINIENNKKRVGAVAETVKLRARLRERWFRLEAARKAQRQQESAERVLMATEDCNIIIGDDHTQVQVPVGESIGGREQRRSIDPSGGSDCGNSSAGGGDNGAGDASILDETLEEGRPLNARCASSQTRTKSEVHDGAAVPCPSSTKARPIREGGDISASAARRSDSSPVGTRVVSAAGIAVIRHSEASTASAAIVPPLETMILARSDTTRPAHQVKANEDVGAAVIPEACVHAACEAGMAGLLNDLLIRSAGRAADGKDKLRRTPLHLAAEAGSLECVNILLKQGTRLDQRDRWRETPMHKAARSGNSGIVKAFCTARMKVNVRNRHRETPLLLAVRADRLEAVSVLLGFGARVDDPDVNGVTPVVYAAKMGQTEVLMVMANSNQALKSSTREGIDQRAIIALVDPARNVRGIATGNQRGLPSTLYHGSASSIRGGGKGSHIPPPALSPAHEAAAAGQTETLSLLLQLGISLEERDASAGVVGDTPLGRAVRAGKLECARLLLDAGAMVSRENARGETPMVIAIRAGKASAVELLARYGAPLDGGLSKRNLVTAGGRAPGGAREKMMARRRVQPLELALREGQFACAAVLIEGGARISEGALRAIKVEPPPKEEPPPGATRNKSIRYAGPIPDGNYNGATWSGNTFVRSAGSTTAALLPLQMDICQKMCRKVFELADSAPPDGGGLVEDGSSDEEWSRDDRGLNGCNDTLCLKHVGGRLPTLGEFDLVLVLGDGWRLPVHSCLLAAASGTFRDLLLRRDHRPCHSTGCAHSSRRLARPSQHPKGARETGSTVDAGESDRLTRSSDVQVLLAGCGQTSKITDKFRQTSASTVEAAQAAAAFAATTIAENTVWQSPAVVQWKSTRGEVLVRFWGSGTMAAIVEHVYTGQPPLDVHVDGLGRLLAAAVSLRMPRLMRQAEHLMSAGLSPQKGSDKSTQHAEAARLLKAARALRATDLEDRCTLFLQANGVFPAVMKLRRELGVPALNASDVARGLARLTGSGYLGSGPAHAWSSSTAISASSGAAAVAAAKREVDLSLRTRAVDFDQLVPLLLDPARCASTLSVEHPERTILLSAAMAGACPGSGETLSGPTNMPGPQQRGLLSGVGGSDGSTSCSCDLEPPAVPLVSNFSAFSHGLGWLLRSGAVADVILVLRTEASSQHVSDAGNESGEVDAGGEGRCDEKEERDCSRESDDTRFPAHSVVLSSRSEKFAAMLRFVQRQDEHGQPCADGDDAKLARDDPSETGCGKRAIGASPHDPCSCAVHRLPRRDPTPRELELHSPLLSPRSLGLFLEFLYTGVLNPWLSTTELSELALIADEYLVPDLTRQVEALLVELLNGKASHSGQTMCSTTASPVDENRASMPLDILQLGVSLGLPELSAAAARAVLLQLESVSRSEAFQASGMSKRELVVAALEAVSS